MAFRLEIWLFPIRLLEAVKVGGEAGAFSNSPRRALWPREVRSGLFGSFGYLVDQDQLTQLNKPDKLNNQTNPFLRTVLGHPKSTGGSVYSNGDRAI